MPSRIIPSARDLFRYSMYVCMYLFMSVCLHMYIYLSFYFLSPKKVVKIKVFKKSFSPKNVREYKSIFIFSPPKSRERFFFIFLPKKTVVKIKSSLFSLPKKVVKIKFKFFFPPLKTVVKMVMGLKYPVKKFDSPTLRCVLRLRISCPQ